MATKSPNRARIDGDRAAIILTSRRGRKRAEALVSRCDLERALAYGRWHLRPRYAGGGTAYVGTAARNGPHVLLHRFLLDAPPGVQVDHVNGDGLDCRRENLRLCSAADNAQNQPSANQKSRSGIRGVYWDSKRAVWHAAMTVDGRRRFLGSFANLAEAERVITAARRELQPFAAR